MGKGEAENAREIAGLTLGQRKAAALEGLKYLVMNGFGETSAEEDTNMERLTAELKATGATMEEVMAAIREARSARETSEIPEVVEKIDHQTMRSMSPNIFPFQDSGAGVERRESDNDAATAEVAAMRLKKRPEEPIIEPEGEVAGAFVFLGSKFRQFLGMSNQPCPRPQSKAAETVATK